jgi:hypothetical protein
LTFAGPPQTSRAEPRPETRPPQRRRRGAIDGRRPFIRYLRTGAELELDLGIPVPEGACDVELPGGAFWEAYVTDRSEPDSG